MRIGDYVEFDYAQPGSIGLERICGYIRKVQDGAVYIEYEVTIPEYRGSVPGAWFALAGLPFEVEG